MIQLTLFDLPPIKRYSELKRTKKMKKPSNKRLDSIHLYSTFIHKGKYYSLRIKQGFICFALSSSGKEIYLKGETIVTPVL
jgi:hypothetical protein